MEPYLPFLGSSYPSSSPPLQLALSEQHQLGDDHDHHFIHHSNATAFLGLMPPPDMKVVPAAASTGTASSENKKSLLSAEMEKPKTAGPKKTKKPKYAFQTRSHVDILDDGYRWRKYGQKAVKNNKFPRSYYRCTYQGCNVKKQVQRLTGDEGVVVTTYEGIHSHAIEKSTDNFEHILSQFQIYTNI